MKYIKKFESYKELELFDYVICDVNFTVAYDETKEFVENNIGRYIEYYNDTVNFPYCIEYFNVPDNIKDDFNIYHGKTVLWMELNDIVFNSKTKEGAKVYLNAKKYNI